MKCLEKSLRLWWICARTRRVYSEEEERVIVSQRKKKYWRKRIFKCERNYVIAARGGWNDPNNNNNILSRKQPQINYGVHCVMFFQCGRGTENSFCEGNSLNYEINFYVQKNAGRNSILVYNDYTFLIIMVIISIVSN